MAQSGRSEMGMRKHGKTGWKNGSGKSPRFRFHAKREAEAQERKAPPALPFGTVADAIERGRRNG